MGGQGGREQRQSVGRNRECGGPGDPGAGGSAPTMWKQGQGAAPFRAGEITVDSLPASLTAPPILLCSHPVSYSASSSFLT